MNLRAVGVLMLLAVVFAVSQGPVGGSSPGSVPDAQTVPTRIRTTQPTQPPAPTQPPTSPGPITAPTAPSQSGSTQATAVPRPTDTIARPTDTPRPTNMLPGVTVVGGTSSAPLRTSTPTSVVSNTSTPEVGAPTRAKNDATPSATYSLVASTTEDAFGLPLLLCGGGGLILVGVALMLVRGRLASD